MYVVCFLWLVSSLVMSLCIYVCRLSLCMYFVVPVFVGVFRYFVTCYFFRSSLVISIVRYLVISLVRSFVISLVISFVRPFVCLLCIHGCMPFVRS